MKTGRPLKFKTAEELEAKGMEYIKTVAPLTITGLALHLGTTRETLMDYQERDEFSDTVKRLKTHIENYAETRLFTATNAAGPIFALKNYGWRDRHELTDPEGNPVAPMNVNFLTATADDLLKLLTAASANSARGRRGPRKASRGS